MFFDDDLAPDRVAFSGATSMTYGELSSSVEGIVDLFRRSELQPGDTIALASADCACFIAVFAACFSCGLPVSIIDPAASARELELILRKSAPRALITDKSMPGRLAGSGESKAPQLTWHVHPSETRRKTILLSPCEKGTTRPTTRSPDQFDRFPISPESHSPELSAYSICTSGTTSDPKVVSISRRALQFHVRTLAEVFGYDRHARLLTYLPTHHTDGLVHGVAAPLFTGMTVVNPGPFDPTVNLKETLRAHEITHLITVPTMLSMIRHHYADSSDLFHVDSFRTLVSTAGYLDAKFWKDFQDFFGVRVSNFYGMTETVSGSLYCGPDSANFRLGTVGKPIDAKVRIVNENGAEVRARETGELQVSGAHLMSGYLNDTAATRAVLNDGWLSTGDLFTKDEEGFFSIVGRKKNIINRGGVTIYPEDLQRILAQMPGVTEVEVIGLPDEIFEEIVVICAVVNDEVSADDIRAFCRREFSAERQPNKVELMDRLPRGPSGKVRRNALIAEIASRNAPGNANKDSVRDRVFDLAAQVFSVSREDLDDQSSPDSVDNWDSYAAMEFILSLEREFGIRLKASDFMQILNIGLAIDVVSAATSEKVPTE